MADIITFKKVLSFARKLFWYCVGSVCMFPLDLIVHLLLSLRIVASLSCVMHECDKVSGREFGIVGSSS